MLLPILYSEGLSTKLYQIARSKIKCFRNLELYSIFFRSYNTIFLKRIICASLGEFLCAKFEISLQTRKYLLVFLVISQMWHIEIRPNTQIILESISILTRIFLTSVLSCRKVQEASGYVTFPDSPLPKHYV